MDVCDCRFSINRQSRRGSTRAQALRNTVDLAQLADQLGFHRYWVAEHPAVRCCAGASPEALVGSIAALTSAIRVGSGGVMLPHYSPFKVAETFTALAALYPDRIDLGVGRAAGTDPLTTRALQRDRRHKIPEDFAEQLTELLGYLDDALPGGDPFAALCQTLPGQPVCPRTRGCWAPPSRAPPGPPSTRSPTRSRTSSTRRARSWPRRTATATSRSATEPDLWSQSRYRSSARPLTSRHRILLRAFR